MSSTTGLLRRIVDETRPQWTPALVASFLADQDAYQLLERPLADPTGSAAAAYFLRMTDAAVTGLTNPGMGEFAVPVRVALAAAGVGREVLARFWVLSTVFPLVAYQHTGVTLGTEQTAMYHKAAGMYGGYLGVDLDHMNHGLECLQAAAVDHIAQVVQLPSGAAAMWRLVMSHPHIRGELGISGPDEATDRLLLFFPPSFVGLFRN